MAREFGIPSVANIQWDMIKNKSRVTLNGGTGQIELHES